MQYIIRLVLKFNYNNKLIIYFLNHVMNLFLLKSYIFKNNYYNYFKSYIRYYTYKCPPKTHHYVSKKTIYII